MDLTMPTEVLRETLQTALGAFNANVARATTLWYRVQTVIVDFAAADFKRVFVARQARQALTALTPSQVAEDVDGTKQLIDLLIVKSLLDVADLVPDYEAYKYSGNVIGVDTNPAYTLIGFASAAPAAPYALGPGDKVYLHTDGSLLGTITAQVGDVYKMAPAVVHNWADGNVDIRGVGYEAYLYLLPLMRAANQYMRTLTETTLADAANKYAYSGSGSSDYVSLLAAAYAAQGVLFSTIAVGNYAVGLVPEVASLISSLREEKLLPVLSFLLSLDFQAIVELDPQQLSTADAAASIMEEIATRMGADLPSYELSEGQTPFSEYYDRPHGE
jgi:hypothetical protein